MALETLIREAMKEGSKGYGTINDTISHEKARLTEYFFQRTQPDEASLNPFSLSVAACGSPGVKPTREGEGDDHDEGGERGGAQP